MVRIRPMKGRKMWKLEGKQKEMMAAGLPCLLYGDGNGLSFASSGSFRFVW